MYFYIPLWAIHPLWQHKYKVRNVSKTGLFQTHPHSPLADVKYGWSLAENCVSRTNKKRKSILASRELRVAVQQQGQKIAISLGLICQSCQHWPSEKDGLESNFFYMLCNLQIQLLKILFLISLSPTIFFSPKIIWQAKIILESNSF